MKSSRLTTYQIAQYKSKRLEFQSRLQSDLRGLQTAAVDGHGSGASRMSIHMADVAALGRIESGTFGVCEAAGRPISRTRLDVIPYTRHCVEYARELERTPTKRR